MAGVGVVARWDGNAEDPGHEREIHLRVVDPLSGILMGGYIFALCRCTV